MSQSEQDLLASKRAVQWLGFNDEDDWVTQMPDISVGSAFHFGIALNTLLYIVLRRGRKRSAKLGVLLASAVKSSRLSRPICHWPRPEVWGRCWLRTAETFRHTTSTSHSLMSSSSLSLSDSFNDSFCFLPGLGCLGDRWVFIKKVCNFNSLMPEEERRVKTKGKSREDKRRPTRLPLPLLLLLLDS